MSELSAPTGPKLWIVIDNQETYVRRDGHYKDVIDRIEEQTNRARDAGWHVLHFVVSTSPHEMLYEGFVPASFMRDRRMHQRPHAGDTVCVKVYTSGFDTMCGTQARAYVEGLNPSLIATCGFGGSQCAWATPADAARMLPDVPVHYMTDLTNLPLAFDRREKAQAEMPKLHFSTSDEVLALDGVPVRAAPAVDTPQRTARL